MPARVVTIEEEGDGEGDALSTFEEPEAEEFFLVHPSTNGIKAKRRIGVIDSILFVLRIERNRMFKI